MIKLNLCVDLYEIYTVYMRGAGVDTCLACLTILGLYKEH